MSNSTSRKTDRQINVRATAAQIELIERAIDALKKTSTFTRPTVPQFVLLAAVAKAEEITTEAQQRKSKS